MTTEPPRAFRVIVVTKENEHVCGIPRLVALHPEAERQLTRAADAVVPRREERDPLRLGRRRAGESQHEDAEDRNPAHPKRIRASAPAVVSG